MIPTQLELSNLVVLRSKMSITFFERSKKRGKIFFRRTKKEKKREKEKCKKKNERNKIAKKDEKRREVGEEKRHFLRIKEKSAADRKMKTNTKTKCRKEILHL